MEHPLLRTASKEPQNQLHRTPLPTQPTHDACTYHARGAAALACKDREHREASLLTHRRRSGLEVVEDALVQKVVQEVTAKVKGAKRLKRQLDRRLVGLVARHRLAKSRVGAIKINRALARVT